MNLKIYEKQQPQVHAKAAELRLLNANRKWECINLNTRLYRDLGLTTEHKVLIAKDDDSRNDWYVTFGKNLPGGSKLRIPGNNLSMRAQCKKAVNDLLDSVNAETTATFIVASRSKKMEDGREWYRIMTANPTRII